MSDIPEEWVEKAARTMWQREGERSWDELAEVERDNVREDARAVIEAVWDDLVAPFENWRTYFEWWQAERAKLERVQALMEQAAQSYQLVHVSDLRAALEERDE